jgi:hypothetical protein
MMNIYLSNTDVAIVNTAGTLWRHEGDTLTASLAALVARLREEGPPRQLRVWLGGSLCRPVRVAPVTGARSRKERLQLAELTAVSQSGLRPPCRVSVDVENGGDGVVAVVVEEGVLSAIEHALDAVNQRARSIRPWWAHALAAALRTDPALRAFGVLEGRALTFLIGEGRGFSSAQTLYPVGSVESASAAFARTLVSAMISPEDAVAVSLDWSKAATPAVGIPTDEDAVFTPWVGRLGATS